MESVQQNSAILAPAMKTTAPRPATVKELKRVSNYRLTLGWLLLVFWIPSIFALDWDVQWHVNVGRDGFWTPPHWMFYSTVAAAGTICLGVTLLETILYYRRYPGINDHTTTPALFLFRGQVGFMLAGFGMAVMLASAPFDDYWHRLFGIDVAIWTPFHVMLGLGIAMANLGIVYLFASELNRRKTWAKAGTPQSSFLPKIGAQLRQLIHPATLGLILAAITLLTRYWFVMGETFLGKSLTPGTLTVGEAKLPAYSLALAIVPVLLVALVNYTGLAGIATLTGVLSVVFRLVDAAFVEWGVKALAVDQGVALRPGANDNALMPLVYPLFLPLAGLVVDLLYLATRRWRIKPRLLPSLLVAVISSLVAGLLLFLLDKPWEAYNNSIGNAFGGATNPFAAAAASRFLFKPSYWEALPLVALIAALAGVVGLAFATSLKYTER
jgi:hypothetical protein